MQCCNPRCKGMGSPSLKGLCMKCYKEAKKIVEDGQASWEELAQLELCRIAEDDASFAAALKRAKEQQ